MKNLEKYYINFDELKVGDTVWHIRKGNVEIIRLAKDRIYSIGLGNYASYYKNGLFDIDDKYPTIYKSNPFEDLKEEPRMIEVLVHDKWTERKLIAIENENAIYWSEDNSIPHVVLKGRWREVQSEELSTKEEIELLKKRIQKLELLNKKF